jgi:glutathione synthase/RimK-type ligase-like ATP-grasp enzyme
MCQGPAALAALAEWERAGAQIVNSPAAAINTYRDHLPTLLSRAGVPFPDTRLIDTATLDWQRVSLDRPLWLKRGDVHASVTADVQRIDTAEMLRDGLADFVHRGITHAALQEHRPGAEIKFYGVAGGAFFHWFYTNGTGENPPQTAALQQLGERAARAAGLDVFGGDIIVDGSGALTLIDLNDWPSFAPCRDAASEAIAESLMRRVDASWNAGLVPSANPSAV